MDAADAVTPANWPTSLRVTDERGCDNAVILPTLSELGYSA
jgi:hypothetical protein